MAPVGRLEVAQLTAGLRGRLRAWPVTLPFRARRLAAIGAGRPVSRAREGSCAGLARWVEPDLDADGVGDAGQVAGVAGDDGALVADWPWLLLQDVVAGVGLGGKLRPLRGDRAEPARLVVLERLHQLGPGVHHERAVGGDRLPDRLAAED